jgi:cytochrome c-type biogenesis protein CcmH
MRLALVVAAALALGLAAPAAAACPKTSLAKLENEVMCPVCQGETIAQSDSQAAAQVKQFIQGRVDACASEAQIKRELVAQYGTQILAAPPRQGFGWLAWLLPAIGLVAAAGAMALLARRWSRRSPDDPPRSPALDGPPLDPELERRLDRELKDFDG